MNLDPPAPETIINISDTQQPIVHEEEYTDASEKMLERWYRLALVQKERHYRQGKVFKFRYELFAFPSSAIPIMYAPISATYRDNEGIQLANVIIFSGVGLLSAVHTFFDFGRKSQRHFEYENKYLDLATTIEVELRKVRAVRIRADRFIEMVQSKIDTYAANAPLL